MTTLEEALTARDAAEIRTELLDDLAEAGCDATGFGTFSVERALPSLEAAAQANAETMRVAIVKAGFLDTAAEAHPSWLTKLARGAYQVERIEAGAAVWSCTLTNTLSGGPYLIPVGGVLIAAGTVQFRNSETGTLLAGPATTLTLEFTAEEAGTDGNVSVSAIDTIVSASPALPGVTVTNDSLVTAGRAEESDADLVQRCEDRWGTLGYGGHDTAIRYNIGVAAPSVTRIAVLNDNPYGAGSVGVILANAEGPATGDEVEAVDAYLQPRKPLGSGELRVLAATEHDVTVTAELTTDGSNGTVIADAEAALEALASETELGPGTLYVAEIIQRLMGVDSVINVVVSAPASDEVLADAEVLTITPDLTEA